MELPIAAIYEESLGQAKVANIEPNVKAKNQLQASSSDEEDDSSDDFDVSVVLASQRLTTQSAIEFSVAGVRKPLASAAKLVRGEGCS